MKMLTLQRARHVPAAGLLASFLLICIQNVVAAEVGDERLPRVAIIIDDIGDRYHEGRMAVDLPGPVACAFLPHTPHARSLARAAHAADKEVLLHLPLQPQEDKALGPGAITLNITETEFRRRLNENIAAIPHLSGVNNHMGSLLTRHPGHMTWLMRHLAERRELYFVDSYTHAESVALRMAHETGVPAARRDVFLDNKPERTEIEAQFGRLAALARKRGSAIGIGHPYPETLAFLNEVLPRLGKDYGVQLVPVRSLLKPAVTRWTEQPSGAHGTPATH